MASSGEPSNSNRPFSIDLSLELEHQLNSEIASPTTSTHPTNPQRESLDPHVLASIIMQLNQDKAQLEAERDGLVQQLSAAHSKQAGLTDSLDILTTKCSNLEEQLSAAKAKAKDDDEAIVMLRSKVEESRRGLMRLQTESRRQSMGPVHLDISRANLSSSANKRQSFTPLTGTLAASRGHRRTASHTDSPPPTAAMFTSSPNGQVVFSDPASVSSPSHPPVSSRRISGFFGTGRTSPPEHGGYDPIAAELDGLRRELQSAKDELAEMKHELSETLEAKEASEQCAAALREFIAENNIGVVNIDKPVTTFNPSTGSGHQQKKSSGWGFNLWSKEASPTKPKTELAPVAHPIDAPTSPVPKFSGLFGSRASMSSNTTTSSHHNKSNTTDTSFTSTVSDASSVDNDEPLSPLSEPKNVEVAVHNPSRSSSSEYALETPVFKAPSKPLPTAAEEHAINAQ